MRYAFGGGRGLCGNRELLIVQVILFDIRIGGWRVWGFGVLGFEPRKREGTKDTKRNGRSGTKGGEGARGQRIMSTDYTDWAW
jgi:hypothetical protein